MKEVVVNGKIKSHLIHFKYGTPFLPAGTQDPLEDGTTSWCKSNHTKNIPFAKNINSHFLEHQRISKVTLFYNFKDVFQAAQLLELLKTAPCLSAVLWAALLAVSSSDT